MWGYAWTSGATGSYEADPAWTGNSASDGYPNGLPTYVNNPATGQYGVTWPGIGFDENNGQNWGNAQVTTVGGGSNWCMIWPDFDIGLDHAGVGVQCFNSAGALANTPFNVSFLRRTDTPGAQAAYLWVSAGSGSALNVPVTEDPVLRYNSTGGTNTTTRIGTGNYNVTMPGQNFTGGTVEVTAVGGAGIGIANCKVGSWSTGSNLSVNVRCFAANGSPVNSQFMVRAAKRWPEGGMQYFYLRANNPTATDYTPTLSTQQGWIDSFVGPGHFTSAATIHRNGTGSYRVRLPEMDPYYSTVKVTAYGTSSGTCTVLDWFQGPGDDTDVEVRCFTAAGAPMNSQFTLSYTGLYYLG